MEALRRFLAIVHADFRERSRGTRFWVVAVLVGIATWWCFPPADAGYVTVGVGGARGAYSSAWIGMVLALMYASMLSLAGFYIVRGTVSRDFETRVWQLLVATPMTRPGYLLAKWTSHLAVFGVLVAVGLAVGLVAQHVRGEASDFSPVQLLLPSLLLAMPALGVSAFFAVLFDLLPWLRRSGGNVLYFFVWIFVFVATAEWFDPADHPWAAGTWLSEPSGLSVAMRDIHAQLDAAGVRLDSDGFSIGVNIQEGGVRTFDWAGWQPSFGPAAGRLLWLLACIAGLFALAPMLDWAAARSEPRQAGQRSSAGLGLSWLDLVLRPLDAFPLGRLVAAELRLVLRQRRVGWWLLLLALWVAQAFAPDKGQVFAMVIAWLLALDVFARAGLRERDTGTTGLVLTAPGAAWRLLAARALVSCGLALALVAPSLLRALPGPTAAAIVIVALSVGLGGLALAVLFRNPRPFELAMVFLAYIAVQGDATLNPLADPALSLARHAWLLPGALLLLGLAWPLMHRRR